MRRYNRQCDRKCSPSNGPPTTTINVTVRLELNKENLRLPELQLKKSRILNPTKFRRVQSMGSFIKPSLKTKNKGITYSVKSSVMFICHKLFKYV